MSSGTANTSTRPCSPSLLAAASRVPSGLNATAKHAPRHRRIRADEVAVVADLALDEPVDQIRSRHALAAADGHHVEPRMPHEREHHSARHVRRHGGDVVDESPVARLDELERLVARPGDDELAVAGKRRGQHPVGMGALLHPLLAGRRVEDVHIRVGAADRDARAVRRPRDAAQHVVRRRVRGDEGAGRRVPNLQLAAFARHAAGNRQLRSIRREPHRLDPLREPDEPPHDDALAARRRGGVQEERFVHARDGEEAAVRRNIERADRRRRRIRRRMVLVEPRPVGRRRVDLGAVGDPLPQEGDFRLR